MNLNRRLRIWVDFYETFLTEKVLNEFVENMCRLNKHIIKLSIVGCSFTDKWRLRKLLKKSGIESMIAINYYSDPEDAKTWLVHE